MNSPTMKSIELVDFKYVFCPVLNKELRLKRTYLRHPDGREGRKHLVDCVGAGRCGARFVEKGRVAFDFSKCPFDQVGFIG